MTTDENVKLTPSKAVPTSAPVVEKIVPKESTRSVTYDDKNLVRITVIHIYLLKLSIRHRG